MHVYGFKPVTHNDNRTLTHHGFRLRAAKGRKFESCSDSWSTGTPIASYVARFSQLAVQMDESTH